MLTAVKVYVEVAQSHKARVINRRMTLLACHNENNTDVHREVL